MGIYKSVYSFYSQRACSLVGQIRHGQETIREHSSIYDITELCDAIRVMCLLSITGSATKGERAASASLQLMAHGGYTTIIG